MSDFFQHGLISTLHRLNQAEPAEDQTLKEAGLGLLLPCHARDIGTTPLIETVGTLNQLSLFDHAIISVNGFASVSDAIEFWSRLRTPHTLLWNDSPAFISWLRNHDLPAVSGKGLNLWSGLGFAVSETELQALVIHDCDIQNYTASLPISLETAVIPS